MRSPESTPEQSAPTLLRRHPATTIIGGIGVLIMLGHVVLGPSVVPVGAMLVGLVLALSCGARLLVAQRRAQRATTPLGDADD
jgi:hypothetical protein